MVCENIASSSTPIKNSCFKLKQREEENKIKGKLKVVYDHRKVWKFQIHWEMEWVVPIKRNTKEKSFCISYQKFFLKYVLQDTHWVDHSVMKTIDAQSFQK